MEQAPPLLSEDLLRRLEQAFTETVSSRMGELEDDTASPGRREKRLRLRTQAAQLREEVFKKVRTFAPREVLLVLEDEVEEAPVSREIAERVRELEKRTDEAAEKVRVKRARVPTAFRERLREHHEVLVALPTENSEPNSGAGSEVSTSKATLEKAKVVATDVHNLTNRLAQDLPLLIKQTEDTVAAVSDKIY